MVLNYSVLDINECSASIPVCDVNANCQNTVGSYVCSCKAGFTGDGKTCAGESECSFLRYSNCMKNSIPLLLSLSTPHRNDY